MEKQDAQSYHGIRSTLSLDIYIICIAGEQRHPPCPLFMLLSTDGVLVTYYMMYSHAEAQAQAQAQPITSPPQDLPTGSVRKPTAANAQGLFYTL